MKTTQEEIKELIKKIIFYIVVGSVLLGIIWFFDLILNTPVIAKEVIYYFLVVFGILAIPIILIGFIIFIFRGNTEQKN